MEEQGIYRFALPVGAVAISELWALAETAVVNPAPERQELIARQILDSVRRAGPPPPLSPTDLATLFLRSAWLDNRFNIHFMTDDVHYDVLVCERTVEAVSPLFPWGFDLSNGVSTWQRELKLDVWRHSQVRQYDLAGLSGGNPRGQTLFISRKAFEEMHVWAGGLGKYATELKMEAVAEDAGRLVYKLERSKDWDLLTTLFWVALRDLNGVAEAIAYADHSDFADLLVKDPSGWVTTYCSTETAGAVEPAPATLLHDALKNARIQAWGQLDGQPEPRPVNYRAWGARWFCGGRWGESVGGAGLQIGPNLQVPAVDVAALSFDREDVVSMFPLRIGTDDANKDTQTERSDPELAPAPGVALDSPGIEAWNYSSDLRRNGPTEANWRWALRIMKKDGEDFGSEILARYLIANSLGRPLNIEERRRRIHNLGGWLSDPKRRKSNVERIAIEEGFDV